MTYRELKIPRGKKLTQEAEDLYSDFYWHYRSCTCHYGIPPCSSCTHPGHPIGLEETDEYWIDDPDYKGSPSEACDLLWGSW